MSIKNHIEEMTKEIETVIAKGDIQEKGDYTTLSFSIDAAYKEKYMEIQTLSGGKFSKAILSIIKKSIESVKL